jgi:RNA polymerase sigma-70 factor (ECF subfamily)
MASAEYCEVLLDGRRGELDEGELFSRIVHCYGREMERVARGRCGAGPDWEDVVQDSMVAVMRYLGGFRGEAAIKTWLFRIVTSACTRMRRGRKNSKDLHLAWDSGNADWDRDAAPDAETVLAMEEKLDCLAGALESLSPLDRKILVLHEGEDLPLRNICEEFDLTLGAVKSRLFRARRQLFRILQARGLEH